MCFEVAFIYGVWAYFEPAHLMSLRAKSSITDKLACLVVNTKHVVHAASVFETLVADSRYCHEDAVCCSD
ncbi:hypothetical protein ABIE61_002772 [Marinobacterium sp. MBR-111]|jgi:hypothetical protein